MKTWIAGRLSFPLYLSLLVAVAAAGCGETQADSPEQVGRRAAVAVTLAPVVRVSADAPLRVTGRVTHARDLKLGFKTGGVIQEILVDEGARVEAGQVVARLDAREIDAGVAMARAALGKAQRDLARVEALARSAAVPGTLQEDAETAAAVARAQVAGARFNRETATLVAPFTGVVVLRLAEPGEVIGPGMPVVVIGEARPDELRVDVGVPARELPRVRAGVPVTVRLDGAVSPVPAEVVEIAPTLTPGTDRVRVALRLRGLAADDYPRGLIALATFAAREDALLPAVPVTALVEGHGRQAAVWLLEGSDRVRRREITVHALRPDGMAVVAAGLDGVAAVIDAGSAWLDEEARVVVAPGKTAP